MDKQYLTYNEVERYTQDIIREIAACAWRADYIVGLTRGGLLPATLISQYFDTKMYSLDVALRDCTNTDMGPESNCWMAEDALNGKNILIVDDINDGGNTLNWIVADWKRSNQPSNENWDTVYGDNVRVATIVHNEASNFQDVNYTGFEINKAEKDVWIEFPWENWWANKPETK